MEITLEYLQEEIVIPYLSDVNSNLYDDIFERVRKKLNLNIQE